MDEFARTRRGQKLFDIDLPKIATQLERIANALERKNILEEKAFILEKKKFKNEGDFRDTEIEEK